MFKKIICLGLLICLISSGCSKKASELPEPDVIYSAIMAAAELHEMIELTSEELQNVIGIDPTDYTSFAAYQAGWGMSPDEIIIVRALDESRADEIEEKLNARVEYKKKSFEVYLVENQPIVNSAVVRRDGVTVAMLITENIEAAIIAYDKLRE